MNDETFVLSDDLFPHSGHGKAARIVSRYWGASARKPAELAEQFFATQAESVFQIFITLDAEYEFPRSAFGDIVRLWLHRLSGQGATTTRVPDRMYFGDKMMTSFRERALPARAIRGQGRVRPRLSGLLEMYERELDKSRRQLSEVELERALAKAAAERAVASALMDDEWLGLECMLAADKPEGTSASKVADSVGRDPDEVAVALAKLVQHGLLTASTGLFTHTQRGASVRSRVGAIAKV